MKKIICSLLLVSSLVWVSAQTTSTGSTEVSTDDATLMSGTTGHAETDNKVKELRKDYIKALKTLKDKFKADLKALIGERKLMHDKKVEDKKGKKKTKGNGTASTTPLKAPTVSAPTQ